MTDDIEGVRAQRDFDAAMVEEICANIEGSPTSPKFSTRQKQELVRALLADHSSLLERVGELGARCDARREIASDLGARLCLARMAIENAVDVLANRGRLGSPDDALVILQQTLATLRSGKPIEVWETPEHEAYTRAVRDVNRMRDDGSLPAPTPNTQASASGKAEGGALAPLVQAWFDRWDLSGVTTPEAAELRSILAKAVNFNVFPGAGWKSMTPEDRIASVLAALKAPSRPVEFDDGGKAVHSQSIGQAPAEPNSSSNTEG